jgi:signal transduction histidine kinase
MFFSALEVSANRDDFRMRMLEFGDLFNGLANLSLFLFVMDYYKPWTWFNRKWRYALLGLMALNIAITLTNRFHNLFWIGMIPYGSQGDNLARYTIGPLFQFSNFLYIGLCIASFVLLLIEVIKRKGTERRFVVLLTIALALPFIAYLLFSLDALPLPGVSALPFGYILSAVFITWIVFNRMQSHIAFQAEGLKDHIVSLQHEIEHREELEGKLRKIQVEQAAKLARQSNEIAGIYDLILLSAEGLSQKDLLEQAIQKIKKVLSCSAICYCTMNEGQLVLESQSGVRPPVIENIIGNGLLDRLDMSKIGPVVYPNSDDRLPIGLVDLGYLSVLYKHISMENYVGGFLFTLWEQKSAFTAEEITLFNGIGESLALILENAHLNQAIMNEAKLEERRRIARDLHDSVTQSLHSLVFSAETASEQAEMGSNALGEVLDLIKTSAWQALKEMRLLLYELRLRDLENVNLEEAIRIRLDAVEKRAGIRHEIRVSDEFRIPQICSSELYPIVLEALNNSLKHARAEKIDVHFLEEDGHAMIVIRDDGVGFDPAAATNGMGLRNMYERCGKINADLEIESKSGQGTVIRIILPNIKADG